MGFDPVSYAMGKQAGGGGGSSVTVEPLTVTENGTYTAPSGKAYSPVRVHVSAPTPGILIYSGFSQLNVSRKEASLPKEISVDATFASMLSGTLRADYNTPGYETAYITGYSGRALDCSYLCAYHRLSSGNGFKHLILDGDLKIEKGSYMFYDNRSLLDVTGGQIDFGELQSSADLSTFIAGNSLVLQEIRFVPNSLAVSVTMNCSTLSKDSIISAINCLAASASGQTITLNAASKSIMSATIGKESGGVFVEDASGTTNLMDYATNVKGWTVA